MVGQIVKLIAGDLAKLAQNQLGAISRMSRQGAVVPLSIGFNQAHLVSDPGMIRLILVKNHANHIKQTLLTKASMVVFVSGVLTSEGAAWKH